MLENGWGMDHERFASAVNSQNGAGISAALTGLLGGDGVIPGHRRPYTRDLPWAASPQYR